MILYQTLVLSNDFVSSNTNYVDRRGVTVDMILLDQKDTNMGAISDRSQD